MATSSKSLELVVLGLLKEQDMHGYELKKRISESFEPIMRVSWGSLYPALARLEAKGAVKAVEARPHVPSIPMTGSLGGERAVFRSSGESSGGSRNKKVYGITDHGTSVFIELLHDESDLDEKSFSIKLSFARYMDPEARLRMLKERRDQIFAKMKSSKKNTDKKRYALEPYVELVLEHFRTTNSSDLQWIEDLISKEEALIRNSQNEVVISTEINDQLSK